MKAAVLYGNEDIVVIDLLECDHGYIVDVCRVDNELDINSTFGRFGCECLGYRIGVALGILEFLACLLVHEYAHYCVFLTGNEILIGNSVNKLCRFTVSCHMFLGLGINESCLDLGNIYGLFFVIDVSMDCDLNALVLQGLESNDSNTGENGRVKGELDINSAGSLCGLECL